MSETTKKKTTIPRLAASASFTEEEVVGLDAILERLRRGGDARIIARQPAMLNVARKVLTMKATIERVRATRALGGTASPVELVMSAATSNPDVVEADAAVEPAPGEPS